MSAGSPVSTTRRMKSFFVLGVCDAVRTHLARLGLVELRPGLDKLRSGPQLVTEHQVLARSQPEPCPQMCTWTVRGWPAGDRKEVVTWFPAGTPRPGHQQRPQVPHFHVAYRHLQLALRFRDEPIPGFRPVLEAHLTASRTARRPSCLSPRRRDHLLASAEAQKRIRQIIVCTASSGSSSSAWTSRFQVWKSSARASAADSC